MVVAGVSLPLLRRRARLRPATVLAGAAAAPLALSIGWPRTRARDVAVCCLQMWGYVAAYKMPHDDPQALESRVHIDYPIAIDRVLGFGELPTARLQRALYRPGEFSRYDKVLVWVHWLWFFAPHCAVAYTLLRHPRRFPRAAVMTYATFDVGAAIHWLAPTAPPWFAVERGRAGPEDPIAGPAVRRMMAEYGEVFWRDRWGPLYSVFGGNPLAAMPSLHFATSAMAATLLTETGPIAGAVGWAYALTLAFALVYLGEHYVIDLVGGAALAAAVRRTGPRTAPALGRVGAVIEALSKRVNGVG